MGADTHTRAHIKARFDKLHLTLLLSWYDENASYNEGVFTLRWTLCWSAWKLCWSVLTLNWSDVFLP